MIEAIHKTLFFCSHRRTTSPIPVRQPLPSVADRGGRTYLLCLNCERQSLYNWENIWTVSAQPPIDFSVGQRIRSWSGSIRPLSLDDGLSWQCVRAPSLRALARQSISRIWINRALWFPGVGPVGSAPDVSFVLVELGKCLASRQSTEYLDEAAAPRVRSGKGHVAYETCT